MIHERCPNTPLVNMLRDVARRLDAIRRTVFVQIPYRGSASVAEHQELIALIASGAPSTEIEKAAREHKLQHGSRASEAWQLEHESGVGAAIRLRGPGRRSVRRRRTHVRAAFEQLRDALLLGHGQRRQRRADGRVRQQPDPVHDPLRRDRVGSP